MFYAAIALVGSVLGARLLGAAGKGEYTFWTLIAGILVLIIAGSIPVGLGRSYLKHHQGRLLPAVVRHGVAAIGVCLVVASACVALALELVSVLTCILVAVPAGVVVYDVLVLLQAAKLPWAYHAVRILQASVITIGFIVLTATDLASPLDWALGFFAAGAVASAGMALIIGRRWLMPGVSYTLRSLARVGEGSTGANVIDFLALRIDQFIVLAVSGPAGLGIYSVAVNWSEVGLYLGHSIGQSTFEDHDTLDARAASRILSHTAWILTVATLLLTTLGWFLIVPVFGSPFADARWVLILLAPGIVARGIGYTSAQILLARGLGRFVTRALAATVGAGCIGWLAFTTMLGINGAAATSSIVYAAQMIILRRKARGR